MHPDPLERRCPRLGGEVTFSYCRTCGEENKPCFKILDCWWERFDVVAYLKQRLPADDFAALSAARTPPDKLTSLVDLIRQAQVRANQD